MWGTTIGEHAIHRLRFEDVAVLIVDNISDLQHLADAAVVHS